ncbi:MAG TPA: hypothetical protein VGR76_12685 [Candidatus Angelobacter sp.]|jgi:hypothetical protein|nr:hypothetical protein [Candidatus Angelobacter sp.]
MRQFLLNKQERHLNVTAITFAAGISYELRGSMVAVNHDILMARVGKTSAQA